jgi:GNAT superfamily N-acetyltransferase
MDEPILFTTKDGRQVTIRRITDSDTALLVDMYYHLSEETKRLRFHTIPRNLSEEQVWKEAMTLSHLDPQRQAALVAIIREDDGEHAVGVARFSRATPTDIEAETAIVVRDDYQSAGIGKKLLYHLSEVARSMDIKKFNAWVLTENQRVLGIISNLNFPVELKTSRGETHVIVRLE